MYHTQELRKAPAERLATVGMGHAVSEPTLSALHGGSQSAQDWQILYGHLAQRTDPRGAREPRRSAMETFERAQKAIFRGFATGRGVGAQLAERSEVR